MLSCVIALPHNNILLMFANLFSSFVARVLLASLFLLLVNLLSGLLAVEFRYPSLWGNAEVFHEYGYPALYNWALMHLPSMLLLALLVFRLPTFSPGQIRHCQLLLLLALVVLFFVEVKLPYGRLRHIPFALFLIVGVLVLLLLSLLFYPPVKTVGAVLVLVGLMGLFEWVRPLTTGFPQGEFPTEESQTASVAENTSDNFFSEVTAYQRRDHVEYSAIVSETVGPGVGPDGEEICRQAKRLVAAGSGDVVILLVHPWFQTEAKYVHHAGKASYESDAIWQCQFRYPEPAT